MTFIRFSFAAAGCVVWAATVASGQFQTSGSDFLPRVQDGTIVTDAHNDPGNFDVSNVRVSPYIFGLIDGDPYFTQDPGFNAPAGSMLPPGSYLQFNILSHLYYWGGTGKVALTAPPNGERHVRADLRPTGAARPGHRRGCETCICRCPGAYLLGDFRHRRHGAAPPPENGHPQQNGKEGRRKTIAIVCQQVSVVFTSNQLYERGQSAMKSLRVFIPILSLSIGASSALADFDVSPTVSANHIQTNAISDATGQYVTNVRVFNFAFDDPTTPGLTQDPGFHTPTNSGFGPSSPVSVSPIMSLTYWSGAGSPTFGPAPDDPTLKLAFGLTSASVSNTAPSGTVFIGNSDASGALHEHIESTLMAPGGQTPASGIYMVGLKLTDPQYTDSQPFYALYNNGGLDAAQVSEAKTYVHDTFAPGSNLAVAPEPSTITLPGLAACGILVRRRAAKGGA